MTRWSSAIDRMQQSNPTGEDIRWWGLVCVRGQRWRRGGGLERVNPNFATKCIGFCLDIGLHCYGSIFGENLHLLGGVCSKVASWQQSYRFPSQFDEACCLTSCLLLMTCRNHKEMNFSRACLYAAGMMMAFPCLGPFHSGPENAKKRKFLPAGPLCAHAESIHKMKLGWSSSLSSHCCIHCYCHHATNHILVS